MQVTVRLARALQEHAGGAATVDVTLDDGKPATVGSVLAAVAERYPAVGRRVCDEQGHVRQHVNVFVDGEKAKGEAAVRSGAEVTVLPAVSGG